MLCRKSLFIYFIYSSVYLLILKQTKKNEVANSCPTLCNPKDCSPPGSSVQGILQARLLEWVAISFSRGSSWPRDWTQVSWIAGDLLHCRQILLPTETLGKPPVNLIPLIYPPPLLFGSCKFVFQVCESVSVKARFLISFDNSEGLQHWPHSFVTAAGWSLAAEHPHTELPVCPGAQTASPPRWLMSALASGGSEFAVWGECQCTPDPRAPGLEAGALPAPTCSPFSRCSGHSGCSIAPPWPSLHLSTCQVCGERPGAAGRRSRSLKVCRSRLLCPAKFLSPLHAACSLSSAPGSAEGVVCWYPMRNSQKGPQGAVFVLAWCM